MFKIMALTAWALNDPFQPYIWNCFCISASRQPFFWNLSLFYHVSYTDSLLFCMQTLCLFLTLTGQVCQTTILFVELLSHCACVCAYTVPVCKMDWANQATQTAVRHPECVLNCLHVVFVWPCVCVCRHQTYLYLRTILYVLNCFHLVFVVICVCVTVFVWSVFVWPCVCVIRICVTMCLCGTAWPVFV